MDTGKTSPTNNAKLAAWVEEMMALCKPESVVWCDGSQEEYDRLCQRWSTRAPSSGSTRRSARTRYLARSDPRDVARVEDRTFICSANKDDAGPTNNWVPPARDEARRCTGCSTAACAGRTMYVIPFSMGPHRLAHRPHRRRAHRLALRRRQHADHDPHGHARCSTCSAQTATSCPACTRSARRSRPARRTCPGPATRHNKYIVHFPETREIWSYGSRLRRQRAAGQEVLRAAHRLGDGARRGLAGRAHADPGRRVARTARRPTSAAAFPSACGKTNFAMLIPPKGFEGWKVDTVGDDIAWIKPAHGRLAARDQPRGRLLRRGAGHVRASPTRTRWRPCAQEHHLHQRARSPTTATSGGRA